MPELPPLPGREEYWNIGYPLLGTLVYITIGIAAVALVVCLGRGTARLCCLLGDEHIRRSACT